MNKTLNIFLITTLVVVLGSLVSCGDKKPPASKTQVVKKKIYSEKSKVTSEEKAIVSKGKDAGAQKSKPAAAKPTVKSTVKPSVSDPSQKVEAAPLKSMADKPAAESAPVTSELIQASMELASTYDPTGRVDPFQPLFSDAPETQVVRASTAKKKKRIPQTPLEKVALSQLKLTAILRMPQGNRALVEDATGKGYVVKKGTYMGLNAGQVIKIDQDSVLVEEEIENMVGEYIINNTELKLQKTAGDQ